MTLPELWRARLEAVWDGPVLVSDYVPELNEAGEPFFQVLDDPLRIHAGKRMLVVHTANAERLLGGLTGTLA